MSGKTNTMNNWSVVTSNIRKYSMFIILAIIMGVFAFLTNGINLSPRNITNIFFQYSYVLILAVGMVQVIIIKGIDLSVGSICAFVGALSAMLYNRPLDMFSTVALALLMGLVIGAWHGVWVAYARLPAFIVTLAGMLLFRGLTYIVTKVNPVSLRDMGYSYMSTGTIDELFSLERFGNYFPAAFILAVVVLIIFFIVEFEAALRKRKTASEHNHHVAPIGFIIFKLVIVTVLTLILAERFARFRGLPIVVIVLLITVFLFHFLLNNTVLGRYIYAVGGNDRSAKLSGINSEMVTFIVFCFMGMLTGLAAVVSTGYMNSALPQAGNLFELDAIAACYIGGVSAAGGIGTVVGVIVGGLVMSAINNGMSIMNMGAHHQLVVKALVLLLAVFYDVYTRRKAGLG
ncbi:MAG: sugar ABC transporter permease [Treponema sp.]|jgi:putative multiple sugar transport system permease protein|nr:sugar ABC transporter permease [Treponema sp.]